MSGTKIKADLVSEINRKTGVRTDDAVKVIDALFHTINDFMSKGHGVTINSFGYFYMRKFQPRRSWSIKHNAIINIPEYYRPTIKFHNLSLVSSAKATPKFIEIAESTQTAKEKKAELKWRKKNGN